MINQQTQQVTHMDRAVMAYAAPQLTCLGSIRNVTAASVPPPTGANPKTGNAQEGNPGVGGGDNWRP